jgi:hypothetical protein
MRFFFFSVFHTLGAYNFYGCLPWLVVRFVHIQYNYYWFFRPKDMRLKNKQYDGVKDGNSRAISITWYSDTATFSGLSQTRARYVYNYGIIPTNLTSSFIRKFEITMARTRITSMYTMLWYVIGTKHNPTGIFFRALAVPQIYPGASNGGIRSTNGTQTTATSDRYGSVARAHAEWQPQSIIFAMVFHAKAFCLPQRTVVSAWVLKLLPEYGRFGSCTFWYFLDHCILSTIYVIIQTDSNNPNLNISLTTMNDTYKKKKKKKKNTDTYDLFNYNWRVW